MSSDAASLVNKIQLADLLGVHVITLDRWLKRFHDEVPMVHRGRNGQPYLFDPEQTVAFFRRKHVEEEARKVERDDELAKLRVPFEVLRTDPNADASSMKQELLAWELRKRQRHEAVAAGQLLPAATVSAALATALGRLSRDTHAFVRQLGREQGWPDTLTRSVEKRLAVSVCR